MNIDPVAVAELIAEIAHRGQVDKAGKPYVEHPRRVAELAKRRGSDKVEHLVVALLHDVVEDTPITLDELGWVFPAHIVAAIDAITHRAGEPRGDYYARVAVNDIAFQVKLADIADNTDPARLAELDQPTRDRLLAKYEHALDVLADNR